MTPPASRKTLCLAKTAALGLICSLLSFIVYFENPVCPSTLADEEYYQGMDPNEKPVVLLWFWPLGVELNFKSCSTYFNIDSCVLTADRSLPQKH
ncbi:uncharacterized protein V6R79_020850 [Siganus canaliculatus]